MNAARTFLNRLGLFTQATDVIQARGVDYWRESIYNTMLSTMVLVGLLAVIPSVWLSFVSGLFWLGIFDLAAYAVVVGLLFVHTIRYYVRATIFLLLALLVGLVVFFLTGNEGAGLFWIFLVPPLASLLLGLRPGTFFLGLNVIILIIIGVIVATNSPMFPRVIGFTLENWVVYAVNFLITNALVTLPLGLVLQGLFHSTEESQKRLASLRLLSAIDQAIIGHVDLDGTISALLKETKTQLDGDAVAVWLSDEKGWLDYSYGLGFEAAGFGKGLIKDKSQTASGGKQTLDWLQMDRTFEIKFGAPLRSKTGMVGLLEIYQKRDTARGKEWLDTLQAIARQASIAIENARLFEEVTKGRFSAERDAEFFRLLFYNHPVPMWIYDLDTLVFLEVNEAAVEKYGYPREEFMGMTLKDIRPAEEVEKLLRDISQPRPDMQHSEGWRHRLKSGEIIDVEITSHTLEFTSRNAALVMAQDVTARKRNEAQLRLSDQILRHVKTMVIVIDADQKIIYASPSIEEVTGYQPSEVMGEGWWQLSRKNPASAQKEKEGLRKAMLGETPFSDEPYERPIQDRSGTTHWIEWRDVLGPNGTLIGVGHEITERKTMEVEIRESERRTRLIVDNSLDAIITMDGDGIITGWNPQAEKTLGWTSQEAIGQPMSKLIIPTQHREAHRRGLNHFLKTGDGPVLNRRIEITALHRDGYEFPVELAISPVKSETGISFSGFIRDITERKNAEREREKRIAELEAIRKISITLRSSNTLEEMLPQFLEATLQVMNASSGGIWLYDSGSDELKAMATKGWKPGSEIKFGSNKRGQGFAGSIFASGKTEVIKETRLDERIPLAARLDIDPAQSTVAVPIRSQDQLIGVFTADTLAPHEISPSNVNLLTTLVEMAGTAIQRSLLNQKTNAQLRQMKGLAEIDRVILSSFDLRLNLQTLVKNVISQLGVDAANIMVYHPVLQTLESTVGSGFRTQAFEGREIGLGEGYAGSAALQREIVHIPRLDQEQVNPRLARALAGEDFVTYYAVPLIAKGEIRGVLEIFHRSQLLPDSEWMVMLNTLASRAAVTIDTVKVFENLQKSNADLTLSYTAAIEGWSHALDLRDKETEGHSQRVTELALKLAERMGMKSSELVHFRRGALLHDIGKMGIPDSILLKPGKLTEAEWEIMRQHTVFARDMLGPIKYLQEAIDIPFSHHEKWDGSGYPLGLKGERIPLPARIFAVVDVYDALTSDRPYRAAWTKQKAIEYIKKQSGIHFDPQVVDVFLKLKQPKTQTLEPLETLPN